MAGSQLALVVCSALFMLTTGGMGVRLLWLARTTGGLPERLIGWAFVILTWVSLPMMAASGMGRLQVSELRLGLFAASMALLWLGFTLLVYFTRETFRPTHFWAGMLATAISSAIAALCAGLVATLLISPGETSSFQAGKLWTGLLRAPLIAVYLWSAVEGFQHFGMARRRTRLGLGNPMVTSRFLLWGGIGLTQVLVHATSLWLHLHDVPMLGAPLGIFVVAAGGLLGSIAMFLLFIPPAFYVRFIERRAGAVEG